MLIPVINNNFKKALSIIKFECHHTTQPFTYSGRIRPSRERFLRQNSIRWNMWRQRSTDLIKTVQENRRYTSTLLRVELNSFLLYLVVMPQIYQSQKIRHSIHLLFF
jgi:hypothetical protein